METVRTQDITFNDLPWKVSYTPERCTMCGSCVAACTFSAIEARIERRSMTVSTGHQPEPTQRHVAVPVIRQKNSLANACVGCGMKLTYHVSMKCSRTQLMPNRASRAASLSA